MCVGGCGCVFLPLSDPVHGVGDSGSGWRWVVKGGRGERGELGSFRSAGGHLRERTIRVTARVSQ